MKTTSMAIRSAALMAAMIAASIPQAADAEIQLTGQVSTPLVVSGGLALRTGASESGYHTSLEAEAGLGGGRIGLAVDSLGKGFGIGLRTSVLRTWIEPIDVDEDLTYLGIDLLAGYERLVGHVGGYRKVDGDSDDDWLFSAGLGWRF